MATRAGTGRWQSGILGALDGVPAEANALVRSLLGREPTRSEHSAAHRAARQLAARGELRASLEPGARGRVLVLLKVSRWVQDGDGASLADAGGHPVGSSRWLTAVVDAAWAAFGADPAYAEELAEAALKLMGPAERAAVKGFARQTGDGDGGSGAEVQPRVEVQAVGDQPKLEADPVQLFASELEAGQVPTIRTIKARARCGNARALEVREALEAVLKLRQVHVSDFDG